MAKAKTKAPEQTLAEDRYLKELVTAGTPVTVKLHGNEELSGTIEFFDAAFVRLTRAGEPNAFLFKKDIKYIWEQ